MRFRQSTRELSAAESAAVIFMVSGHTSDFDGHWERAESKGEKCTEGKEEANYSLKYNDGKYLKSFQHFTDVPSSKTSSARQPKLVEPQSPAGKQSGEFEKHEENKSETLNENQENPNLAIKDVFPPSTSAGYRVGFGVDGARSTVNDGN